MARKKPTAKVTGLAAPSRVKNSWGWQVKWGVPAAAKKGRSAASGVEIEWELDCGLNYKNNRGKWILRNPRRAINAGINFNDWTKCWINGNWDWSNGFKKVTRNSFYPRTKYKIRAIHARVKFTNNKGKGPEVHVYRAISTPRNPALAVPEHAEKSGTVSCAATINKSMDEDARECYDTVWQIKAVDTRVDTTERVVRNGTTTAEQFTMSYDVEDRLQLSYDDYVKLTFEAWSRGFNGDSSHSTRVKYISFPGRATIQGVDIPTLDDSGKVTVRCSSGATTEHPVTEVKLQAIRSVPYAKAEDIPSTESWDDTGAVDNGTCTALSQSILDLRPTRGTHTWVRIKTIHEYEMFSRYSAPVELSDLFVPPASAGDDTITVISAEPGEDGTSIAVNLGWNADGEDDSTGTELTWSDFEEAWRSTNPPQSFDFSWSDGPVSSGGTDYQDSARVLIRGLDKGTRYYIRARRYLDGDTKSYSDYCSTTSVITGSDPGSVVLLAPRILERGRSLSLSWSLGDGTEQTSWEILTGQTTEVDKRLVWTEGTEQTVVANGEGSGCSCSVTSERLLSLLGDADEIPLAVRSARSGDFAESDISVVKIADAPSFTMTVPSEVTTQGPVISFGCSTAAELRLTCSANGATGDSPDGMREQATGDVVWSDAFTPDWTGEDSLTASITLPTGLDLWDGAGYTVRAVARDVNTGLECEPIEAQFTVAWARQAPAPPDDILVEPRDETDEDGVRTRSVTIRLVAPSGAADGDVYDVYRVTPDGVYAIAVDQSLDAVVTDNYAPYGDGDKIYRVAIRTSDGDFDWMDYPYELDGSDLRIDFGNDYIELPWNVVISDKWEKDFESRSHLGVSAPEGYWNDNVKRSASLSTDTIKVGDEEKRTTLRALAQHTGPCFVRTVTGSAFEANVVVSGLEYRYATEVCAVTLDASEVGLTREYMAIVSIPEGSDEPVEPEVEP